MRWTTDNIAEGILKAATVFLAEFHILWCLFHSFAWKLPYKLFEEGFALLLLIGAVAYYIRSVMITPDPLRRIRVSLRKRASFEQLFLIGFFIWFAVDCILHQTLYGGVYLKKNDWRIFQCALAALLYCPFVYHIGTKKARHVVEGMVHFTVSVYGAFCAWVLWNYLHSNFITFPSGKQLVLVEEANMSMRVGVNQNITAAQAATMFSLCIYMIITQKKRIKLLYIIPSIIFTMMLILSNSRSSFIASFTTVIIAMFIYARRRLQKKKGENNFADGRAQYRIKGNEKSLLIAGIALVTCAVLFLGIRKAMFMLLQYSINASSTETIDTHNAIRLISSGLSGRGLIWHAAVVIMFSGPKNFFLGVMPSMVGQTIVDMKLHYILFPHCHNLLLQVGTSLGVPSMIMYLLFLISLLRRSMRIIKAEDDRRYEHAWAISMILLCILIIEIMETFLFGPSYVNAPVFYLFAGWLIALDKSYTRSLRSKKSSINV